MTMKITPRWYGGKGTASATANERKMLGAYHARLEELKLAHIPPSKDFNPVKGLYAELYRREVGIMKRRIRPGDVVLDAGAGYGRLVEAALQKGAGHVIAMEPDKFALAELERKFGKNKQVTIVPGVAQDLGDIRPDIVTFVGNNLGMMWKVIGDWKELVCMQKEAIREMLRVAKREVSFTVYGKETIESSLKAYEPLQRKIVGIEDGLMLIEAKEDTPYRITGAEAGRFVFQKFDRHYLENLLADAGVSRYEITGIPKGTEYGYLVTLYP